MARYSSASDPQLGALFSAIGAIPTAGWNGAWTVSFWVKAVLGAPDSVILNHKGAFHTDAEWSIVFSTAGNEVQFFTNSASASAANTGSGIVLPDGNWHHVAYRRGGAGAATWDKFLDGAKTTINASLNFTLPAGADSRIGVFNHSMPNVFPLPFEGYLDDIVSERRAISDGDIAAMAAGASYGSVNPSINASLNEVYWRCCDDDLPDQIIDYGGNNRHAVAFFSGVFPASVGGGPTGVEDDCPGAAVPDPPSGCAVYKVYVDWDGDGDFSGPDEEVSCDVNSLKWEYGRDGSSQLTGRSSAGTAQIELFNYSGKYSSFNAASPIFGSQILGIKVKITMQIGTAPVVTMYVGYLRSLRPSIKAMKQEAAALLEATGVFELLAHRKVTLPMQTDIRTGEAIAAILDAISFPAADRQLDTGQTRLPRFFTGKEVIALDALRELEDTEGGFLREGKDGKLIFEDRAHRFTATRSTVSQATYTNDTAGTIRYSKLAQEDELKEIYNKVTAEVRTFNLGEEAILWQLVDIYDTYGETGRPVFIAAGLTITLEATFPTPKSASDEIAVDDWTIVDYEANTQDDGQGTDVTSDVSATKVEYDTRLVLTFTNTGYLDAYLIVLRARGVPVVEGDPVEVSNDPTIGAASIAAYGEKVYPFPGKWITSVEEAQAFADYYVDLYKDRRPALSSELTALRCAGHLLAHLIEIQARDVSDRITIVASADKSTLGISDDFFVERLAHEVTNKGVHTMAAVCSKVAGTEWPAMDIDYDAAIRKKKGQEVPDQICATALANGRRLTFGVTAGKWNDGIYEAEFRVKLYAPTTEPAEVDMRLPTEGGADFDPATNPTTDFYFQGLGADHNGCNMEMVLSDQRTAYYAARLKNQWGWSVWSDGNNRPRWVDQHIAAEDPATADDGPPADWQVLPVLSGPLANTVVVQATRPQTNGNRILWYVVQIKDKNSGSWRLLDENAGAALTIYDGSAESHTYSKLLGTLVRDSGAFPALTYGDLILFDVRGGAFDVHYCQWATVVSVAGDTLSGLFGFRPRVALTGSEYLDVRIKIVRPPDQWITEGYFGAEPNRGLWLREYFSDFLGARCGTSIPAGDTSTSVFESAPMAFPSALTIDDIEARVWFENAYSRADDGARHSTGVGGTAGSVDTEPPGPLVDLLVTGERGVFTATWKDPTDPDGNKTLVKIAEQYSTDPTFATGVTTLLFAYTNYLAGRARNKAYYFRFAAQNRSGLNDPSLSGGDIALLNALGSAPLNGWGPWTEYGAPDLVQSGPAFVLTDADTVDVDLSKGTHFILYCDVGRVNRDLTFSNPDSLTQGFLIEIHQSAYGGNTWTYPANVVGCDEVTLADLVLSTGADAVDRFGFIYNADADVYVATGKAKNATA